MEKKKRTRIPHSEETKRRMSVAKKKLYSNGKPHPSEKRQYIYIKENKASDILTSTEMKKQFGISPAVYITGDSTEFIWSIGLRKGHRMMKVEILNKEK